MNDGSAQVHATGAGRRVGPLKQLGTTLVFCATALWSANASATSILFIGNSFTYGYGSPVRYFHADSVTDLNREGVGGVPALFKAFTVAAGLDYDVYLETHGDVGLDWHVDNKRRSSAASRGTAWSCKATARSTPASPVIPRASSAARDG